jgi:cyclopropane-fatty-acyl-phospholipid synthase
MPSLDANHARASAPLSRKDEAALGLLRNLASSVNVGLKVKLWTLDPVPLGDKGAAPDTPVLTVASAGVISSLLHRPTLDRLIQHYIHGDIAIEGGSLIDLGRELQSKETRRGLKHIGRWQVAQTLMPFVFARGETPGQGRAFAGDYSGDGRQQSQNKDYITFHYDVGNDFYRLFLDPLMQYSCGYFRDWGNPLEQAQVDKLDMICRKLRLKPGERFLDIGCGWGGLICHAAEKYGVMAHGITLSESQLEIALQRIRERGLEGRVTAEIKDYAYADGQYDKIASIGMYEHVGLANAALYLGKVKSLLAPEGLYLNHAITRPERGSRKFGARPEHKALRKYIFPGGELDTIGNTLTALNRQGFEIHDVEGWRHHYALTTRHWYDRLTVKRAEAVAQVGEETVRIWLAYLAGCSLAFERGSALIYQTLVSKLSKAGPRVPPTRDDLYT